MIANRGEIAVRVIRAAKDLGISTIAVYSEADRDSLHVALADEAVCVGPPSPGRSYLKIHSILAAALAKDVDAIHPGYGFLSENASFAEACEQKGVCFVGPSAESIRLAGDKVNARKTVAHAKVPVVPGSDGAVADREAAERLAWSIGFPLLLKAKAGGGGRGMRVVRSLAELKTAWGEASGEATSAFGDGALYLERYLEDVRHIEVQIMADRFGRTIALGERDCSIQRRHQKLLEEAPSPALDSSLRMHICRAAVRAAEAVKYRGAGTVEFLFDVKTKEFFFIEMNARIQVEHPVTEALTGVDLVAEQLRIACGLPLSLPDSPVELRGHAIECRINAEDAERNFMPVPGRLNVFRAPGGPGVRLDTHCYEGYSFPPNYDSLMAKLVVHGVSRTDAIRRMRRALSEFRIEGLPTTIPFHLQLLAHPDFVAGNVSTSFVDGMIAALHESGTTINNEITCA